MSEPQHPSDVPWPDGRQRVHVTYRGRGDSHAAREAVFATAYEAMTGHPAAEFTSPPRPQLVRITYNVLTCTCPAVDDGTPHLFTDRCPDPKPCLVEESSDGGSTWRPIG